MSGPGLTMLPAFDFHQFVVLFALVVSNTVVVAWWIEWPPVMSRIKAMTLARRYQPPLLIALLLTLIWMGIFVVARYPVTGDTLTYQAQGRMVIEGLRPNVDFGSSYLPLFPYLMGTIDRIWHNTLAIPVFFALTFVGGAILLMRFKLDLAAAGIHQIESAALVGALNGAAWFLALGYQQDESLLFLFVVLGLLLAARGSDLSLGILLAGSLYSTKLLFAVICVGFIAVARNPRRVMIGFAMIGIPIALALAAWGFRPSMMFSGESGQIAGPSLIALIAAVPPVEGWLSAYPWVAPTCAGIAVLVVSWVANKQRRSGRLAMDAMVGITAVWLVFLLLSPKSLTSYRLVVLPMIPLVLFLLGKTSRGHAISFAVYSTALGAQYMLYEDWISSKYALFIESHLSQPHAIIALSIVLLADIIILAYEIRLLWAILTERHTGG